MNTRNGRGYRETLLGSLCTADAAAAACREGLERLCYRQVVVGGVGAGEQSGSCAGRGFASLQAALKHSTEAAAGHYQAGGARGLAAAAAASGGGSWTRCSRVKSLGAPSPLCSAVPAEEGTA